MPIRTDVAMAEARGILTGWSAGRGEALHAELDRAWKSFPPHADVLVSELERAGWISSCGGMPTRRKAGTITPRRLTPKGLEAGRAHGRVARRAPAEERAAAS